MNHERRNLEKMQDALRVPLAEALVGPSQGLRVEYLCEPKDVADDPAKLLVRDADGRKLAVVLVSSPLEPDLVGRGMRVAAEAKRVLDVRLGAVILDPLGIGMLDGRSYTILPFRKPLGEGRLARHYWRRILRPRVLDWLGEVARQTTREVAPTELRAAFEDPLRHLVTLESMSPALRRAAERALTGLSRRDWTPRFVLMHGDLWEDNLLLAARTPDTRTGAPRPPFVLIDWPGAKLQGYPFFDLLRIARSMRLGRAALRREVLRHGEILGIDADGATGHLLACLGRIGLDLGFFPVDMYTQMSTSCFADLRAAFGIEDPSG